MYDNDPISYNEIENLKKLLGAVNLGELSTKPFDSGQEVVLENKKSLYAVCYGEKRKEHAALIVAAINFLPGLIALVEQLQLDIWSC